MRLYAHFFQPRFRQAALLLILPAAWLVVSQAIAQTPPAQPPADPGELVRQAINNQIQNDDNLHYFTWMERVQKPKGTETKRLIQTPEGVIGRLVAINDKPLTPEQRKQDDQRLKQLLDPEKMREKAKSQKEDEQHTLRLLRAMPDAFIYKYAGTEISPQGHQVVRLDFTPNPKFNPPNRETQVFQGMQGQMWIDTQAMRLAKIDGTLFRDVNFGWGILGRLNKGGRFVVEQAQLANGYWDTVRMQLKFDGKILMIKPLHIEEIERDWDFRPVPKLDVQQALNVLRQSGDQVAQDNTSAAQ
ncbi:MAG: hypothetical protein ABSD88_06620 [Candidatus Korobacteraceae bacterium]|jgi:hypothetical protein